MNDNLDDFSLQNEEQSLDSGFVIAPRDESVSIITDEFEASISTSSSEDTPLAQIIGRFNFFGKVRFIFIYFVLSMFFRKSVLIHIL